MSNVSNYSMLGNITIDKKLTLLQWPLPCCMHMQVEMHLRLS